jgi:DNA-binding Lrp family transcriptional regulator
MDNLDEQILEAIQNDFPLCERPYDEIAEKLGISADSLFCKVRSMLDSGVIRRVGVSLDSRKLGYSSTLAAIRVKEKLVEHAGDVIRDYREVTHSYLRDDNYNIWFTLIAPSVERIVEILEEIRSELSLDADDVLNLPVERLFKLDARFKSPK